MTDFDRSITFILKWEGDLTSDTGGLTRWGISQKSYPDLDIANLTLEEAKAIYKRDYWDKLDCDDYNNLSELQLILFDTGVNCGIERAKQWLEETNLEWAEYLLKRIQHYTTLAQKPKYQPYFRGWMNRVMDLYRTVSEV